MALNTNTTKLTVNNVNVRETNLTRKLTISGNTEVYKVHKIRIDLLRYNHQNDRIATWVSKYKAEHNGCLPPETDIEAYNNIIEGFIVESNEDAIKKTSNNIKLFGQQVPAVVLSNGLVVDGNRRFTCLRRLAREDAQYGWIDAVILDESVAADAKGIKMLELTIQHGEESKVGYGVIERLVGVYNDIIASKLLTIEEYAHSTNSSVKEIAAMVEEAQLMADYLKFINAEGQFHLAREMEVGGAIHEMPKILRRCASEDEQEIVKNCMFANMVVEPKADITRHVRKFGKILDSSDPAPFIEQQAELAEKVCDKLAGLEQVTSEAIRDEIRSDCDLAADFNDSMDVAMDKVNGEKVLDTPAKKIESAVRSLEEVDLDILKRISAEDGKRVLNALDRIEELLEELRQEVAAE